MWTRKQLKAQGKKVYRQHAFRVIAVCFLMSFLVGEYGGIPDLFTAYDETQEIEGTVDTNYQKRRNSDVLEDVLEEQQAEKEPEGTILRAPDENSIPVEEKQKYSRGVLAAVFNSATQWGSFLFGLLDTINKGLLKGHLVDSMIMSIGMLLSAVFYIFGKNILRVGECRFFMESLTYPETQISRLLMIYRVRRTRKTARTMLLRNVYQFLWDLTVVGGCIKHYSYLMVPYILAENPNLESKEVFRISKDMMHGNKWRAFVLDLSYFWWYLLGFLTLGLADVFFLNPYRTAARAALYMQLRGEALERDSGMSRIFNDIYLAQPPVWEKDSDGLYPYELFTIPEPERREWLTVEYRRDYSIRSYILLFFTFSGVGWIWEVFLRLVENGDFVNRGVLYGPWLPIYGSGGVLILILLKRVRENVPLTFILTVLICGTVEYVTSWYLEMTKHMKWWDYSGYLLNLNGRICAEGLLVFGLGGCVFIYFAAPLLDDFYKKIPVKVQRILCIVLIALFLTDMVFSRIRPNVGKGITDYESRIEISSEWRYWS